MKTYKGLIEIQCTRKRGCVRKLKDNVEPSCFECKASEIRIVDLKGKTLETIKHRKAPRTVKG